MASGKSLAEKVAAWRRYRDTLREFSRLSDHDLADIGVRRGDVREIAAAHAQKV